MNSIFGIGPLELFFIAILALVILGPERLPGAIREGAKYFRMLRNMSGELTSQFSEELKALDDINPKKIMNEMMEELDLEEQKKALNELNPKKIRDDVKSGLNPKKSTASKSAAANKTEAAAATTAVAATVTEEAAEEATITDGAGEPVEPVVDQPLAESDKSTERDGAAGDGPVDASGGKDDVETATETAAPGAEAPAKEPIDILARSQPKMTSNPYSKSSVSRQNALEPDPEPDMSGDDEPIVENRIAPDGLAANIESAETSSEPEPSVSTASVDGTSHDSADEIPQDTAQNASQDIAQDPPLDNTGDRA